MNFHILTLFPEMVLNGLNESITGRAIKDGKINIEAVNIRDFSDNKHGKVDDYTYGGGAGMLMQPEPVYRAYESLASKIEGKPRVVYVTPQGHTFDQNMAGDFSKEKDLVILCGHYEGIDERVLEEVVTDYVSIGDYVLTGGELAAMIIVDAVSRLVPGVLHNDVSAETESFHGSLLEYPQYSRPQVWHGKEVPPVLMSGNQKNINKWRLEQSLIRTKERRPDLYSMYIRLEQCRDILLKEKLLCIDMIELINRGQARIRHFDHKEILLEALDTGYLYHYLIPDAASSVSGEDHYEGILAEYAELEGIIVHQPAVADFVRKHFNMDSALECYQSVYTRKEKLPVTGLYRPDGKPTETKVTIRDLGPENFAAVREIYKFIDSEEYIYGRLKASAVAGAYVDGKLAGIIGNHDDGTVGMLEVKPEYRRHKIGKALLTYKINQNLEKGWIPYGQIVKDNQVSLDMSKNMGLYISKSLIYRFD